MARLRIKFGNVFRLSCNDICIGVCNVATRATNIFPSNATASFRTFISDYVLVRSFPNVGWIDFDGFVMKR